MRLIPPPRPEYWVLSLSGGKDSTALGLEWLKRHTVDPVTYPLHEVVYCDTWMEFPAMVEHINRLEKIFTDAGIKFTRIKHEKTFEYFMFEYQPERSNPALQGRAGWSWPEPKARWCTAVLKYRLINEHLSKLREKYTVYQLIGLAADEENRLQRDHNQDPTHKHPLVEWGWDEAHCLQYCYDHGFDCMRFSTVFLAGVARYRALKNCEICESIFPICGQSCWTWNTELGEPSGLIIRWINLKSDLPLRKNGWPLAFRLTPVNFIGS